MTFTDNEITLRYAVQSDAEQLPAWWNDGAVMAHAGFPNGLGATVAETLKNIMNVSDDGRRLFIIEIGGVAAGEMSFRAGDGHTAVCRPVMPYAGGKIAEIGIKICRADYREKGYGTRVLRLFVRALFEHYGFDVITLNTNMNNTLAQRVYEKVGFERAEVKENVWQSQQTGEWASVVYYYVTNMYFKYSHRETEYLKRKDKRLGAAIDAIGHIEREVNPDLFSSVVHNIVGQQISNAALKTVWARLNGKLGNVTAETVSAATREDIQVCGITFKKADYIKDFADKVQSGEFDIDALRDMPDAEVAAKLSALKGIGVWTAEMLMIFCMQRPDVMSYGDLAIHRGLRMLYRHKAIDRKLFNKYAKRYSPYGTVASLYLWAIAGGAIPEMRDYAPGKENRK